MHTGCKFTREKVQVCWFLLLHSGDGEMKVGLTLDVTSTRGKGTQHGRVHWVKDSTDCSLTQLLS